MAIIKMSRSAQINCRHDIGLNTKNHHQQNITTLLNNTINIYTNLVKDLISITIQHWDTIQKQPTLKQQKTLLEQTTHTTTKSPNPSNPLDEKYPKMPAYLRRSAYADALTSVKSWFAQVKAWQEKDPATRGKNLPSGIRNKLSPRCTATALTRKASKNGSA